jgi:hypothetical protein
MANQEPSKLYKAIPEELPKPTYAPFFVAMGVALLFWGLISSFIISIAGVCTFAFGLGIWIKNLLADHE